MSDTARTTSKDDDDIDIYSELPNFKYDENLLKLEGDNKALKTKVTELLKKVKTLEIQLKTCEKTNTNYRRNISMLFLSARREIERKDRTIAELRSRSFQTARRDFPRQNRNEEATGGQNISRNLDGERIKPTPAISDPPVVNTSKKFGYIFTAGNSRSGLYKCKYPAKDEKAEKSCKGNSVDSNKKTGCSNIVKPTEDSKEIRSKCAISSTRLADENRSSCSKNNANSKEDCVDSRGEEKKAEIGLTEMSLKRKLAINDDSRGSPMTLHERHSKKSSSRSKSPIASDRRRSPKTLNRKSSPISSDKSKSPISSSKSSRAFERRRSPRISDRKESLTTSNSRKSPRKYLDKRSSDSRERHVRSGSVFRRLDHRSRSTRSRSRVLSTFRHSNNRDSVTRDVGSRGKLTAGESSKLKDCVKSGHDNSGVKSVPRSQTANLEELKSVESNKKTMVDSLIISNQINSFTSSDDLEINVESHAEIIQVSENIPVYDHVVVSTTDTKSADESMEEVVKNQTTIEELERIKSLPPLIGPWTQFSVRRYKKLHGFSPVKPDSEKKKTVNIRCIEKKNVFENKIERTVVTEIDGKTTKEIVNIELDKVLESNKVSDVETSNKTLNIDLAKDVKQPESNKTLEFSSASETCVLTDHNKDKPSNVNNQQLDNKQQSGVQPSESSVTLSKPDVVPINLESNKDDHFKDLMLMRSNSFNDNKTPNEVLNSDKDISRSIVNSELSVENLPTKETSNCIGNGKSDELPLEKITDKLLTNNQGNVAPINSITDNITTELVSIHLKEPSKEIGSSMSEIGKDFEIVSEVKNDCVVENENQADNKDSKKVMNEIIVDAASKFNQLPIENESLEKVDTEKENCSGESEQLKPNTYETDSEKLGKENEIVVPSCANVLLTSSTEDEDTEKNVEDKIVVPSCANVLLTSSTEDEDTEKNVEDKICSELSSGNLQSSSENEVLESHVEGLERNDELEKMDEVDTIVKEREVESNVIKGVFITESASNAFDKSESPEIDESPTDKSDCKLTVEKPKIIDNISSSLHTFNSALDFSISTTNTNSLNADSNIEQQKQKSQLSASSLQVVNALKKLPKIRENFLQLFGESSNQDNTGTETSSVGNTSKTCSNTTSNKESKLLSCSSSLSSSSSSSLSSSSSSITQDKSNESTIPQVIRLFGIDITEEHSPFHVSKSASQNSILDDKVDDVPHSTVAEICLKSTPHNKLTLENKSEIITGKNDSGAVNEIPGNKSVGIDSPLEQVVMIGSKKISVVESSVVQEKHFHQEKTVISKEIICEEPVIFPVPIIVVDKVSDDKSSSEKTHQENKVTMEYYSNFTEALRNETNVSTSKSDLVQPDFQFESPSRYIMRINNNSVTSHKGLEMTESQSITGEDTLTMVRRLAKPLDTVSPIKTPSKRSVSRKPTTIESPDDTVSPIKTPSKCSVSRKPTSIESPDDDVIENKEEEAVKKRVIDCEKKVIDNEKNLVENVKKITDIGNKFAENKNKLVDNKNELAGDSNKLTDNSNKPACNSNKLAYNSNKLSVNDKKLAVNNNKLEGSDSTCILEQPKSVAKEDMKTNPDLIAKKDKVSVSLSSEHFEFRRRRSSRPIVKLKSSSISLVSKKEVVNKSEIVTDQKFVKHVTTPPKSDKQNEPKLENRPTTSSKIEITQKLSALASEKDSNVEKQLLSSPQDDKIKQKLTPRRDSIGDNHLSSPKIAPILGKRPLIIPRNDTVQRTQGFKRRRVVVNRFPQNDLVQLGPTNEKTNRVKNCEQKDHEKNRSSTSGLGLQQRISEATDSKVDLKRSNDGGEKTPGKQIKVGNSVSVSRKNEDLTASGKGVNETRNSSRHRLRDQVDSVPESSLARSSTKVSDTARSSKRSGVIDLKTDFCERRSPSEYFNRRSTMNRRHRVLLRDKKLQRCRSPLVTRRRVDKYMMNMRETRERKDTRNSDRSVENGVSRRLKCDSSIEWKLKPVDIKLQKNGSLFERLVAENVLNKLEKPRTFIIADPTELTPPPMVLPCPNDNRVLVDQSNRSNQLLSSPGTPQCTDTQKSTNNTPEHSSSEIISPNPASNRIVIRRSNNTPKVLGDSAGTTPEPVSSEIISPNPTSNKIVIIRRRSNNTPKVLGDSAGTFIKTNTQVNSVATEEKTPVIVRRERSNAIIRQLEDSPLSQTNLTASTTVEQASCNPKPCNENHKNDLKKEEKNCESNSRAGPIRSTRIVKTQLDFRSRLRRSRK